MQIRWSPAAAEDLEQIFDYIVSDSRASAQHVAEAIYERADALGTDPYLGRRGRVEGTRELALPPLPFIIVYRVLEQFGVVQIVNVIHGAQRWPRFN